MMTMVGFASDPTRSFLGAYGYCFPYAINGTAVEATLPSLPAGGHAG